MVGGWEQRELTGVELHSWKKSKSCVQLTLELRVNKQKIWKFKNPRVAFRFVSKKPRVASFVSKTPRVASFSQTNLIGLREHGVMVTSWCYGYMLLKTRAIKPKLKFTLCIELLFACTNPTPRHLRASCLPCTQYKFTYGRGRGKTCLFFQVLIHGSPYVHYVPGQKSISIVTSMHIDVMMWQKCKTLFLFSYRWPCAFVDYLIHFYSAVNKVF